jgi:hypothetical protein
MPLLEAAIGDNRQQWADVAASLHAARGIPRPTVAELFSTKPETQPKAGPLQGNLLLLQAALRKLQSSPETDDLLIGTWIANAPFNAWGSANSLVEYTGNPVTTETLRQALRNDLRGSSYIAMHRATRRIGAGCGRSARKVRLPKLSASKCCTCR